MQVIILAGGNKCTVTDSYEGIPKPMVDIGGKPILWHIMKMYSSYGFNDFIICAGYKSNVIKDYFADYYIYQSDITVDLAENKVEIHNKVTENWNVVIADTGLNSTPKERLCKIEKYIDGDDFILTYGDCLHDINIDELVKCHKSKKSIATVAVSRPAGRNAMLPIDSEGRYINDAVLDINYNSAWVNTCCEIFNKNVFDYIHNVEDIDRQLFVALAEDDRMIAYKHHGFWIPIDNRRDKIYLDQLWEEGRAPWKCWDTGAR